MKRILSVLSIAVTLGVAAAQASDLTTVILVRHAEKASNGNDPDLSETGRARAQRFAELLTNAGVDAIYTSQFRRTQQTGAPLAQAIGITPRVVQARPIEEQVNVILSRHRGQKVVVVGHSDTVPELVKALGVADPPAIDESEYFNLFVVTIAADGEASMLRLYF